MKRERESERERERGEQMRRERRINVPKTPGFF